MFRFIARSLLALLAVSLLTVLPPAWGHHEAPTPTGGPWRGTFGHTFEEPVTAVGLGRTATMNLDLAGVDEYNDEEVYADLRCKSSGAMSAATAGVGEVVQQSSGNTFYNMPVTVDLSIVEECAGFYQRLYPDGTFNGPECAVSVKSDTTVHDFAPPLSQDNRMQVRYDSYGSGSWEAGFEVSDVTHSLTSASDSCGALNASGVTDGQWYASWYMGATTNTPQNLKPGVSSFSGTATDDYWPEVAPATYDWSFTYYGEETTPKADSTITGRLTSSTWPVGTRPWINGRLTVTPAAVATGSIQLLVDGKVARSFLLSTAMNNAFYLKLPWMSRGQHTLQLKYLGSSTINPSASGIATVRVTR